MSLQFTQGGLLVFEESFEAGFDLLNPLGVGLQIGLERSLVTLPNRLIAPPRLLGLDGAGLGSVSPGGIVKTTTGYGVLSWPFGASGSCVLKLSTIRRSKPCVAGARRESAGLGDGGVGELSGSGVSVEGGVEPGFELLIGSFGG